MPYALCPMPYALCPMPDIPHLFEKGYISQYSSFKKIIAERAPGLAEKCHSLCDCNPRKLAMTKNVK